jgi:hypothetical protein
VGKMGKPGRKKGVKYKLLKQQREEQLPVLPS